MMRKNSSVLKLWPVASAGWVIVTLIGLLLLVMALEGLWVLEGLTEFSPFGFIGAAFLLSLLFNAYVRVQRENPLS